MPFARLIVSSCAVLMLAGCNPFAGISANKVVEIADNQSQSFDLLVPGRKIPASATRISADILHFQDTSLRVKFDAPVADAEAFMRKTVGKDARNCDAWPNARRLKDWPGQWPSGGLCLEDKTANDPKDNGPAITIAMIPHGATATVLVATFDS